MHAATLVEKLLRIKCHYASGVGPIAFLSFDVMFIDYKQTQQHKHVKLAKEKPTSRSKKHGNQRSPHLLIHLHSEVAYN